MNHITKLRKLCERLGISISESKLLINAIESRLKKWEESQYERVSPLPAAHDVRIRETDTKEHSTVSGKEKAEKARLSLA